MSVRGPDPRRARRSPPVLLLAPRRPLCPAWISPSINPSAPLGRAPQPAKVFPRCAGRCRRPLSSRAEPARPTTSNTSKSKPGSATTAPASRSPANCSNAATSASRTLKERSCRKTLTSAVLCERWRRVGPPASALRGWASNRPGAALADACRGERPGKRPGVTAWSAAFARNGRRRAAKQRLASASRSALRAAPGGDSASPLALNHNQMPAERGHLPTTSPTMKA
jgi:hypothetical protein